MTRRLSAVVGEYQDKQTNQQKADWQNIGIIGIGKNNKEYVLLDPSISLAGILVKQNVLAAKRGDTPSDMVMASVFDDSNQQAAPQQGGYQQQSAPQQSGGFQQNNNNNQSQFAPQNHPQQSGYNKQ